MGRGLEQTFFQRKYVNGQNGEKRLHVISHQGNATPGPSEMPIIPTRMAGIRWKIVLAGVWGVWHPCALLTGMGNGAAAVRNSLAVPRKGKHRLLIGSSHSALACLNERMETRYSDKNWCTNVHSSLSHSSQNWKQAHAH